MSKYTVFCEDGTVFDASGDQIGRMHKTLASEIAILRLLFGHIDVAAVDLMPETGRSGQRKPHAAKIMPEAHWRQGMKFEEL